MERVAANARVAAQEIRERGEREGNLALLDMADRLEALARDIDRFHNDVCATFVLRPDPVTPRGVSLTRRPRPGLPAARRGEPD